jgi:hypothetical protein
MRRADGVPTPGAGKGGAAGLTDHTARAAGASLQCTHPAAIKMTGLAEKAIGAGNAEIALYTPSACAIP